MTPDTTDPAATKPDAAAMATTGALLRASIAVRHAFDVHVNSPAGLDADTVDLLLRINTAEDVGLRGVDCARQLRVSPTQVTRLADRAEGKGLVARTPDPTDRRAQRLVLTDAGRATVQSLAPKIDGLIEELVEGEFSALERAALIELLDRLTARARSIAAPKEP